MAGSGRAGLTARKGPNVKEAKFSEAGKSTEGNGEPSTNYVVKPDGTVIPVNADGSIPGVPTSGQGYSSKGYNPQPGERTFEGYVNNNVSSSAELNLHTNSSGFNNNNGNVGANFKRFGIDSHAGISPHVHQPTRNDAPNGNIYGGTGSKTANGGVTSPTSKDVKQLYDYLNNAKYH